MKLPLKHIVILVICSLIGIFVYQAYWLTGLYRSMKMEMESNIRDAMRTSDFNEVVLRVNDLQKEAIKYVSAKAQFNYLSKMIDEHFFTDEELNVIFRARNHKVDHRPKNCDISTYKYATGLEAVIGHLYLKKDNKRIEEIMNYIKEN